MTSQSFNRPGAVDLSSLVGAGSASSNAGADSTGAAAGSYVQQVGEADFDAVVRKSASHPVIMELYSPRANAQELSDVLIAAANAGAGRFLLARVNIDAEQRIAQAMGVQAVPTVVAIIGGQLAPLFQGTKPAEEVQAYLDQVMQVAVANGLTGRAEPVGPAQSAGDDADASATPAVDPRFAAADAALEQGDYATAVQEFQKVLDQAPADQEAIQGLAQAKLLERSTRFDPQAIVTAANAEPSNWDAQLDAADLELINGDPAAAFDRILQMIRQTRDEDRERARLRLLELFDVVGKTDQAVLKARRQLSTALFA
ncbi:MULTISPECIES: tetratricopeptide repeat protein [unclassified Luteococcus]|uniref:tetratricopeptide repeat protein n=1 Tax=unclassified Luteococcus TaxID=2639923 RepID=UPI00313F0903